MTLNRLNDLRTGLNSLRKIQEELEINADSIPQNLTGMPSAKGISNSKENKYISLMKNKKILEKRCAEMSVEYSDAIKYIANIKEHTLHLIFYYRFLNGYEWNLVAQKLGGKNTADSVRMRVKRYLEKSS